MVRRRVGEHSYVVEIKEGVETEAHRSQLRPHIEDTYAAETFPLYYFSGKAPALDTEMDRWLVEEIREHRGMGDQLEFLVKWAGCEEDANTWEPLTNLVTLNELLMEYCQRQGVGFDIQRY